MFYTQVFLHFGNVYHIGYENGEKFIRKEDSFMPHVCLDSKHEDTSYRTLYGKPAFRKTFDTIKEFSEFRKEKRGLINLYDDISPVYQFINETYKGDINYKEEDIRVGLYDIETPTDHPTDWKPENCKVPIASFALKDEQKGVMYVCAIADYEPKYTKLDLDCKIKFHRAKSESELLRVFIRLVRKLELDILCGFYSEGFDDPYILKRILSVLGDDAAKGLSPIGAKPYITEKFNPDTNRYDFFCRVPGLTFLDFQRLYKKYVPGERESNSLNYISRYELGEEKVDYEEYENLFLLWQNDKQTFIDYNIFDVELISRLNKKLKLIELQCSIAYMAKCNLIDAYSPVRTWDCLVYSKLSEKNICIPEDKRGEKEEYPGGYVVEPEPDIYKWMVSFDINSLYPHCAIQYNISPETIVKTEVDVDRSGVDDRLVSMSMDLPDDVIVSGSGYCFDKSKRGIFPTLFEEIYAKRANIRAKMKQVTDEEELADMDMTQYTYKILMNSAYGAMANRFFRYYDIRLARSITLSGQLTTKYIIKKLSEFFEKKKIGMEVTYGDTDSVYLSMEKFVNKYCKDMSTDEIIDYIDDFATKVLEVNIDKYFKKLADYMSCNFNAMVMKREKIIEAAIFGIKKRYACLVWDNEGKRYPEAKLSVTGFDIVRSSTPSGIKKDLEHIMITFIRDRDSVKKETEKIKEKFMEMPPEVIAFPRSANNLWKYEDPQTCYKKRTPIAVRAVLTFNKFVEENRDILPEAVLINEGTKIKFVYMQTPNPFYHENVIGFVNRFPVEEYKKYIDYDTQFKKCFENVVTRLGEKLGIDVESQDELDILEMLND